MFFILSKLFNFLLMPFTWIVLAFVVSFFWKKHRKRLRVLSFILLMVFSNSFLVKEVNRLWEIPITTDQALEKYQAGVVLGGFAYYDTKQNRITFRESGDRLFQGIRLLENGTIDHLIVSGGSGYVTAPELREALFVEQYLDEINIPKRKVWIEADSKNTHENAVNTSTLLKEKGKEGETIVLCTSGYHMRRAMACFEKQGINVVPYSTDPKVGDREYWIQDLLFPSAYSLAYWNVLIHEWLGYISYKIMGYI